jgi:hypothetical protein
VRDWDLRGATQCERLLSFDPIFNYANYYRGRCMCQVVFRSPANSALTRSYSIWTGMKYFCLFCYISRSKHWPKDSDRLNSRCSSGLGYLRKGLRT